ncbi:hypothetical protein IHE45_12G000100 [Dioscorea alata]|uniref:Uncharacterized protein n=1 Tax=Dioscorea alata TaxID=55571 RepID=A0ACB7UZV2_DIOAL|nr:hypothetical protein IHE45_12G000100 [Dioscorea alata]
MQAQKLKNPCRLLYNKEVEDRPVQTEAQYLAMDKLLYLSVAGMDDGLNVRDRICFLNTMMDLGSEVHDCAGVWFLAMLENESLVDTF